MRIAVVTTSYPRFSGDPSGHFVREEVDHLSRSGDEVVVFAPKSELFAFPGVAVNLPRAKHRAFEVARDGARLRRDFAAAQRDRPFERIVAHWAFPSAFLVPSLPTKIEVVSHGADVRLLASLPLPARVLLVSALVTRASEWRFVSERLRDDLLEALPRGLRARCARIARIGASPISLERDLALEERVRQERVGRPYWVSVGRLVHGKRVQEALRHAARHNHDIVVVGDGPERAALEALARSLSLRAAFVGQLPRPEALAWIANADALLLASKHEGLSTVGREARAFGVRVIELA